MSRSPPRGRRRAPVRPARVTRLVCVAVNASIDKIAAVDRLVPGQIHRPELLSVVAGGKPINVARAASRLGIGRGRGPGRRREHGGVAGSVAGSRGDQHASGPRSGRDPHLPLDPRPVDGLADGALRGRTDARRRGMVGDRVRRRRGARERRRGCRWWSCRARSRPARRWTAMRGSSGSPRRRVLAPRSTRTVRCWRAPSPLVPGSRRATPARPHTPPGSPRVGRRKRFAAAVALQERGAGIALVSRGIDGTIVVDEAGIAWRVGPSPERGDIPGRERGLRAGGVPGRHRRRRDDRTGGTPRGRSRHGERAAARAGRDRPQPTPHGSCPG